MSNQFAEANSQPTVLGGESLFARKLPIVRPTLPEFESVKDSIAEILASGMLTKGEHLRSFEEEIAAHLGVEHAVGLSSCTSGLMLTYQALGLKGEVVVPSYTFMATVSYLRENPDPSEGEVRHALEGNLCRCTGYHNIVQAVLAAAGELKSAAAPAS